MTDFGLMISKCLVAHGMCIQKSYKNDVEHEGGGQNINIYSDLLERRTSMKQVIFVTV